ncbi:PKD domain-containing protein, partial [Flavobacteriales bacterium]|nr:PKD domain-containing protein [Flavobacteriales bacterium]
MLKPISATPQVIADFTTASANTGCGSLVVEFLDLSTGSPTAWLWDFGNGNTSNLKNPASVYTSPGIYNVSLNVTDGISSNTKTENGFIRVHENPTAELLILGLTMGCTPLTIDFMDVSVVSTPISSWQWDFGDGGSSSTQHSTYEYLSDGLFSVSLSIEDANGCQDIVTETNIIKVNEMPIVDFDADITFSCNPSETISFNNTSIGAVDYFWDFGDGTTSTLTNPTHTFTSGTYTITLCAKAGVCIDSLVMTDLIQVGASLTPNFTTNVNNGCENLLIDFHDITNNDPDTWFWDFGDGNTSTLQNPSNNYLNPGMYDVTLTTSINGECTRTITYPSRIEVFPKPNIDFSVDTAYGCAIPFTVQFTDNTANAVNWNWHFSNGVTMHGINPIVTFTNYGLY